MTLTEYQENYPSWFRKPNCGYSIPTEWEEIIYEALACIAYKSKRWQEVVDIKTKLLSEGKDIYQDYRWIVEYFENNPTNPYESFHIQQLKEKFGSLRFYWSMSKQDPEAWGFVDGIVTLAEGLASYMDTK